MSHGSVRISPDGKLVAATDVCGPGVVDLRPRPRDGERQTFDGHGSDGVWSPDGQRLVFRSNSSGPFRLYLKSLTSQDPIPLTSGPLDYAGSFTPDGKEFVFSHGEPGTNSATYDIHVVSIDDPGRTRPLLNTKFSETYPNSVTGWPLAGVLFGRVRPVPGLRSTLSRTGQARCHFNGRRG